MMEMKNDAILTGTLESLEKGYYYVQDKKVPMCLSSHQQEQARCYLPEDVYTLFDLFDTYKEKKR